MQITDVRIDIVSSGLGPLAFADIIVDDEFAVKDIKVLKGNDGMRLAMPAKPIDDRCACGGKNWVRARFCNWCGLKLADERWTLNPRTGKPNFYANLIHPITKECRAHMEGAIIDTYYHVLGQERLKPDPELNGEAGNQVAVEEAILQRHDGS